LNRQIILVKIKEKPNVTIGLFLPVKLVKIRQWRAKKSVVFKLKLEVYKVKISEPFLRDLELIVKLKM